MRITSGQSSNSGWPIESSSLLLLPTMLLSLRREDRMQDREQKTKCVILKVFTTSKRPSWNSMWLTDLYWLSSKPKSSLISTIKSGTCKSMSPFWGMQTWIQMIIWLKIKRYCCKELSTLISSTNWLTSQEAFHHQPAKKAVSTSSTSSNSSSC